MKQINMDLLPTRKRFVIYTSKSVGGETVWQDKHESKDIRVVLFLQTKQQIKEGRKWERGDEDGNYQVREPGPYFLGWEFQIAAKPILLSSNAKLEDEDEDEEKRRENTLLFSFWKTLIANDAHVWKTLLFSFDDQFI